MSWLEVALFVTAFIGWTVAVARGAELLAIQERVSRGCCWLEDCVLPAGHNGLHH